MFLTSAPSKRLALSEKEQEYVKELVSIQPLESILTDKNTRKKCKDLGQKIFDEFKSQADGNSLMGETVVKKICNAIHFESGDGRLRKQYIERAWDGIGDKNWQWRS